MTRRAAFMIDDWLIEPELDRISRGDEITTLRPRVMDFLVYLAQQDGGVFSTNRIIDDLWSGQVISHGTVYNCVTELRRALGNDSGGQPYIENIPRRGYRLRHPAVQAGPKVRAAVKTRASGPGRRRFRIAAAIIAVAVIASGLGWLTISDRQADPAPGSRQAAPANSIAVLPFANISTADNGDYFSDGLTETLLHGLSQLPELRVVSRASSFHFKNKNVDIRDIAARLNVATVLQGVVQRDGDDVRIVVHLIDAKSGNQIWSQTYDHELTGIFDVQDDIAKKVVTAMRVMLAGNMSGRLTGIAGTSHPEAYEHFLKGLHQWNIETMASIELAEGMFRSALALDPAYYDARRALARTYFSQRKLGILDAEELEEKIAPLLDRLLSEKPYDGIVLGLRGLLLGPDRIDIDQHVKDLTFAIARSPNEPDIYEMLAAFLRSAGRLDEAETWLRYGLNSDPLAWTLHFELGKTLAARGDPEGAGQSYARAAELNPYNVQIHGYAAIAAWTRDAYADWYVTLGKMMHLDPLDHEIPVYLALHMYALGIIDRGNRFLERAVEIAPGNAYVRSAELYRRVLSGDTERVLELSEAMLRDEIEDRRHTYWFAAMIYTATMADLDRADEALKFLDELRPGISSPGFRAANSKDVALQYHALQLLNRNLGESQRREALTSAMTGWDRVDPRWRRLPFKVAPVEAMLGRTDVAIDRALDDLARGVGLLTTWDWKLRYEHVFYFRTLAAEGPVGERLAALRDEASVAAETIRSDRVAQDVEL